MASPLRIIAVQHDIVWQDAVQTLAGIEKLLAADVPVPGSLLVFPELCDVGFTMDSALAARSASSSVEVFAHIAKRHQSAVVAGLAQALGAQSVGNCSVFLDPSGRLLGRYVKSHGFSPGGEHLAYATGQGAVVWDFVFPGGSTRIAPAICYDLRFPELFRQSLDHHTDAHPEVYLVIANWPAHRQHHWRSLLMARAIENQAYVLGVNRVGRDPSVEYAGGSILIDPRGQILFEADSRAGLFQADLDLDAVRAYRTSFPPLRDRRLSLHAPRGMN